MTKFCLVAGWVALALIAFVTLAPISDRPTIAPAHTEHFVAFFVLGLMFMLAYPNRIVLVLLIVVGSAVTLEAAQLLTPDRHGRLMDASVKIVGAFCGIGIVAVARIIAQAARSPSRG